MIERCISSDIPNLFVSYHLYNIFHLLQFRPRALFKPQLKSAKSYVEMRTSALSSLWFSVLVSLPPSVLGNVISKRTRSIENNLYRRQIQVDAVDDVYTITKVIQINTAYIAGDQSQYAGNVGVNTEYLTSESGTLKWIGVNSDYLYDMPITTTDSAGQTVTTSKPVGVSVAGDKDASGNPIGDSNVLLSPGFLKEVTKIAGETCTLSAKRSGMSCNSLFTPKVMTSFEVFAAAKLTGEAIGGVTVAGFIAELLKDMTEKGKPYPLDVNVPHRDLTEASVIAIVEPTAPVTMTIAVGPPKPVVITASSTSTSETVCWRYVPSQPTMEPDDEDYADDEDADNTLGDTRERAISKNLLNSMSPRRSRFANTKHLFQRNKKGHLNFLGKCSNNPIDSGKRPRPPNFLDAITLGRDEEMEDYRWYIPQSSYGCSIALLGQVGARKPDDTSLGDKSLPPGYQVQGRKKLESGGKYVNVDHVCKSTV
jgi:hypothetical protein